MSGEKTSAKLSGNEIVVLDLGFVPFHEAHKFQLELVEKKARSEELCDYLLFVEHPDVYTFGRKEKTTLIFDGAESYAVERGGGVTFHNPGQMVCYPIMSLGDSNRDLHRLLRKLEAVLIHALAEFGLMGERREGATGVWIKNTGKKIASIGIAVSRWVTFHGVALNVRNDLRGFGRIQPCGFSPEVMTSMEGQLGKSCPTFAEVKGRFLECFCEGFAYDHDSGWVPRSNDFKKFGFENKKSALS